MGISHDDFEEYKTEWILWRTLGYYNESGIWVAPVSYIDAISMPKRKLDAFFALDNLLELMKKQHLRKKKR